MDGNIVFPVYRKYSNNKSYFKVLSEDSFEEIQILGKHYLLNVYRAKILPDRYLIKDMIDLFEGRWEEIQASEYNDLRIRCV